MEVHAHTHTARKKWTHYFWEFLNVVSCGFIGVLCRKTRKEFDHKKEVKS